jgi:type IV pilus assembly protein PilV
MRQHQLAGLRRVSRGRLSTGSSRGFSLVELMVALIVLSVGLLGVARLQSLALSSTSIAAQRSLAAIEAASLAAAMHENRGYWVNGDPAGATISVQGTTFSYAGGAAALSGAAGSTCLSTASPCTPTQMAAYDLQMWATSMTGLLPGYLANISCGTVSPVSCSIVITWTENAVAVNATEAAASPATMQTPTYMLYVEP